MTRQRKVSLCYLASAFRGSNANIFMIEDRVAPDTIAAWESADAAGRRRLIRLSRIWDDPRFRDYIYMLEPGEVEFMRTLPQSQKRGFFSAVAGKKLSAKGERLSGAYSVVHTGLDLLIT